MRNSLGIGSRRCDYWFSVSPLRSCGKNVPFLVENPASIFGDKTQNTVLRNIFGESKEC